MSNAGKVSVSSEISNVSGTEGDDTKEPLGGDAALEDVFADTATTWTPTNCDRSRQNAAGRKEGDPDCNLELKDVVNFELLKVMEVKKIARGSW